MILGKINSMIFLKGRESYPFWKQEQE